MSMVYYQGSSRPGVAFSSTRFHVSYMPPDARQMSVSPDASGDSKRKPKMVSVLGILGRLG